MGRIDPALIQKGEGSTLKIVKFRGQTQPKENDPEGHVHKFVVYTDDSVEIFEHVHIDEEGVQHKHRHKYIGDYPNGYIVEDHVGHIHKIISVAHPIIFNNSLNLNRELLGTIKLVLNHLIEILFFRLLHVLGVYREYTL